MKGVNTFMKSKSSFRFIDNDTELECPANDYQYNNNNTKFCSNDKSQIIGEQLLQSLSLNTDVEWSYTENKLGFCTLNTSHFEDKECTGYQMANGKSIMRDIFFFIFRLSKFSPDFFASTRNMTWYK